MKIRLIYSFIFITILTIIKTNAQQNSLIFENDSIAIYDTYLSLNSKENISPTLYNNGLIYASADKNDFYKLYFSDLKNKPQKIKINNYFHSGGPVTTYNNEIYFVKSPKLMKGNNNGNLTIFKGEIENLKVSKVKPLSICKADFTYGHPTISKDGNKMVIVTNERGIFHLLELQRNNKNEWEKSDVVFISQSSFTIINPTIYDENTIYFSSNISEAKIDRVEYTLENGNPVVDNVYYATGDFNIYKTIKVDGKWSLPQKVSVLNSEFDDLSVVFITEKTGYINSFRYDDTDNIYYFELKQ